MMLPRLREQTAELHREVESRVDLLSASLTTARYIQILQAFHAFFKPAEAALEASCPPEFRPLWKDRRRAERLREDLRSLGAKTDDNPSLAWGNLLISGPGDWLGCIYVMEGSTLGGQVISRQLEEHFDFRDGVGYSFFQGHGKNTRERWRTVCELLEAKAAMSNQIVQAAHLTFDQMNRCLRHYL